MKNTRYTFHQNNLGTIRTEAEILVKEFRDFKSFLNIIKMSFNHLSLVGGAFRSYSNNREIIVETGFPFFRDMSFDIFNIKPFLKSISALDKKPSITVTVNNSSIEFEDYVGPIGLSRKDPYYLDNKFISDKEMIETVLNNVDPNKLIVSEAIPKISVCRIKQLSRKLSSDGIYLKYDKNDLTKGFLSISFKKDDSKKKDDSMKKGGPSVLRIELKKPLLIPMKKNHYFKLNVSSTIFNKDHLYLKCYFTNDQKIFAMYSTKVNDLFVNIYSNSELIEES